ncbi:unnamed protein product (macronuclear) [Paramecium tetraurelia]|uniref:B box-type domain-containing protein n=1 Tax=Paramecium tetraurelia TaxID=5888 RepID=A0C326_PARTE|nr:uncharacterized protein GSPATT00034671001 [Paramecium tetraurelia]CAK65193.1 unnamed protein product [Paramecium tetraurelia]|eukprot:XP_001432590.1 hypothetical protein (macronuclear) [Paramecium tetraurelia strain d4-2]
MNRSQSPINDSRSSHSASKRYVSPNERQNTQENEQNHRKLPPTHQVKSKIINADQSDLGSILGEVNINNTSKMSNMTQFANFMYVPCPTHPEFFITNLCQDQNCIEPLCPECINEHLEMHQSKGRVPKLENIQRVRKDNTYKIDELSKSLQFKLQDSKKYFSEQPSILYNNNLEQLRQIHEQISNIIDDYFETLYKDLKEQNQDEYIKQLNQLEQDIMQQQHKLTKLQEDLHNDNYVRAVIQICDGKQEIFSDKSLVSLEKLIQNYQQSQIKIIFDKNNIELFQTYCKKMCYFVKNTQQPNTSQIGNPNKSLKLEDKSNLSTMKITQISEIPPPLVNPITLISESLSNEEAKYQINHLNHFEDGKPQVLVRLEEGGYAAYIYDIQSQQYRIETINSTIKVPLYHRLYTTTAGKHLVIGGVDRDKSRFKAIASVYEFNHTNLQLIQHSEMVLPRSMTSACQVDNFLFVVGGSSTNDENTSMAKAEKLDLNTKRWQTIEDPHFKCSGCALVAIDNNTLFKIGGKCDIFTPCNSIESYDIQKNSWTKIEFKFLSNGYLRLPFNSCAIKTSYDQILILGGSVHDVKSNETQVQDLYQQQDFQFEDEDSIEVERSYQTSIEFNTQSAIVQFNNVYLLTENEHNLCYLVIKMDLNINDIKLSPQSRRAFQANKKVKSISIQRNLNQISSDIRCITDESPTNLHQMPVLGGSVTERQINSLRYRPSVVHRQMYSDHQFEQGLQRRIVRQKLPSINQGYSVHELSQNRMSVEPRMSPPKYMENKKSITEVEQKQSQNINDLLSIKKLNDLLGRKKIRPEQVRKDFPSVPEIQDFSKQMLQIYKKNNINPLKLRSPIPMQTQNRNSLQIDLLINLLKKRN